MEKLIYVLVSSNPVESARLADLVVPEVRALGGERIAVLSPDRSDEIKARGPGRLMGAAESIAGVVQFWLPALDVRGPVEEALRGLAPELWGYIVTESTVVPCPHETVDGARVPGITQWSLNDKPADVAMEDFYREWQEVHSKISFALHPARDSYQRNAVARRLTPEARSCLAITLERFPSLEVFTDDARYFGDPAVVREMIEHLPTFYDFASAISTGLCEYRYA